MKYTSEQKEMLTYKEIFKKHNIKVSILSKRVFNLKIKGFVLGFDGTVSFNKSQVKKILMVEKLKCKNHPRKIQIIDLYQKGIRGHEISSILKISTKLSYDCIREYNSTNTILIESKMNLCEI